MRYSPGTIIYIYNAGSGAYGADGCLARVIDDVAIDNTVHGYCSGRVGHPLYAFIIEENVSSTKMLKAKVGEIWSLNYHHRNFRANFIGLHLVERALNETV